MKLLLALIAVLTVALLTLAACGDDNGQQDDTSPSPSGEPSTETPRDDSVRSKALEAVREYVESVGFDGETGRLTDPIECPAPGGDGANGDYCIAEPGTYGPGLALVLVADAERPQERGWQVRVLFENDEWHVTEAVSLASD